MSAGGERRWAAGDEVARMVRTMTAERMAWYADMLDTVCSDSGRRILSETNIHTDDAYAKANGLPGIIADGMISTNWIQTLLVQSFGAAAFAGATLRTRYSRPILSDDVVTTVVRVREVDADGTLRLEVWSENQRGERCTVGEASIRP